MTGEGRPFVRRVASVFGTRLAQFGIGITTSFLLSRLLGPAGRGAFALATLVPSTLFALAQLGLPSAFSFFAGKRRAGRSLWRTALVVGLAISLTLFGATLLALPWLEATVLINARGDLVRIALISLPFQFLAAFCGAILIGRQTLLVYNLTLIGQSVLALTMVVVLVGALDLGTTGAVIGNLAVAGAGALAMTVGVGRTTAEDEAGAAIGMPELLRYGLRLYPASVTSFFSYRVDIFLLGFLLAGSTEEVAAQVGLYTLAVSLAELTFFVPDSVATVFFPRVAGAERRSADEMTPMVSRMTVLVTIIAVLSLIPAAYLALRIILPAFVGSFPAFVALLPGVVALAVAKVLSSYILGIGLPLPVAVTATGALVVNVAANFVLIPAYGIVGASLASVVSYGLHTAALVVIAARLARRSPFALVVPSAAEARRLMVVAGAVLRRAFRRRGGEAAR